MLLNESYMNNQHIEIDRMFLDSDILTELSIFVSAQFSWNKIPGRLY